MMKRLFFLMAIMSLVTVSMAQDAPKAWNVYKSERYYSKIETGYNYDGMSDVEFKKTLADAARLNLARMLEVKVNDYASSSHLVADSDAHSIYNAKTVFSTNVNLKFVKVESVYYPSEHRGYAIAFVDKSLAIRSYKNEIEHIISKGEAALDIASSYISSGFKSRAREELEKVLPLFEQADDAFFALTFFDSSENYSSLESKCYAVANRVKQMYADMKHSTAIYIKCNADVFGSSYTTLANDVKGELSKRGCSFTSDRSTADYIIEINASAREHTKSKYGNSETYFSYVDAAIDIQKCSTSQNIYTNEVSVKGSSTRNFNLAANDAFRKIFKEISNAIINNIEL